MHDYYSNDIATAQRLAALEELGDREGPSPAEYDDRRDRWLDGYSGICGGCETPVTADSHEPGGHEGSCLWRGGPWHPSCRRTDQQAGGTWDAPPPEAPSPQTTML